MMMDKKHTQPLGELTKLRHGKTQLAAHQRAEQAEEASPPGCQVVTLLPFANLKQQSGALIYIYHPYCQPAATEIAMSSAGDRWRSFGVSYQSSTVTILKVLLFFDFFSVACVVTLFQSYFAKTGIEASRFAIMSSTYMIAQLVGGLMGGVIADAVSKRTVLLLSFLTSAASYLLIYVGSESKSFVLLLASRILVGLFKQTYTVCTLVITEIEKEHAATSLGHLSALMTAAFIVGPVVGSFLYKTNTALPCIVAATVFVLNAVCALAFLPSHLGMPSESTSSSPTTTTPAILNNDDHEAKEKKKSKVSALSFNSKINELMTNFAYFASLPNVGRLLALRLLLMAAESAVSSRHIISYNEKRYGLETYQLGFLSSFTSVVSIAGDAIILPIVLLRLNAMNDATLVIMLIFATSIFYFIENFSTNLYFTLVSSSLPLSFISSVLGAKLKTIQLVALPKGTAGKFLGVFSLLSTGIGIASPLYAGVMYTKIDGVKFKPLVAGSHVLLVGLFALLFPLTSQAGNGEKDNKNEDEINTPEEILKQAKESEGKKEK